MDLPKLHELIRPVAKSAGAYELELSRHLRLPELLHNPYRNPRITGVPGLSKQNEGVGSRSHLRNKDTRIYSKTRSHRQAGSFSCIVTAADPMDASGVGTTQVREESVRKALTSVAKRAIICYDTRIVETGAVLKALQNVKLDAPVVVILSCLPSPCTSLNSTLTPLAWPVATFHRDSPRLFAFTGSS